MGEKTLDGTHACYTNAGSSTSRESTNDLSLLQLNNGGRVKRGRVGQQERATAGIS